MAYRGFHPILHGHRRNRVRKPVLIVIRGDKHTLYEHSDIDFVECTLVLNRRVVRGGYYSYLSLMLETASLEQVEVVKVSHRLFWGRHGKFYFIIVFVGYLHYIGRLFVD